jgi:hypothetical protein
LSATVLNSYKVTILGTCERVSEAKKDEERDDAGRGLQLVNKYDYGSE